ADIHTPSCSRPEQVDEVAVWREIRVGYVQRLPRAGDRQREEALGGRTAQCWFRIQEASSCSIQCRLDAWPARKHHARCFDPCRGERGLELSNRRSLEADVGFPPRTIVVSVAQPFVVDAEPAGPTHFAVDHDASHMRAVLSEMQRRETDGSKGLDHDAG